MNQYFQDLVIKANSFPEKPGIYLFKNKESKIIYIGKAKSLNARIKTYFIKTPTEKKIEEIQENAYDIEFITTNSETDALILENELIKIHKPKLNARLKDDKTYPYLKITVSEKYPRVEIVRKREDSNDIYFGPYTDVKTLREALNKALTIFPIARCKKKIVLSNNEQSCLYYQMERCVAPCASKINYDDYQKTVKQFIKLFEGKQQDLIMEFIAEMEKSSAKLEFEKAAIIRDKLHALKKIIYKQTIVSNDLTAEYDIIGMERDEFTTLLQLLMLRQGRIVEQKHFMMHLPYELDESEIIAIFIKQYYSQSNFIPKKILTKIKVKDDEVVNSWLNMRAKNNLEKIENILQQPKSPEEENFIELAYNNAKSNMISRIKIEQIKNQNILKGLRDLKEIIGLDDIPARIEGYDISTLQGSDTVGSRIVFEMGKAKKADYRKYIIKAINKQDDFLSLREIIRRRFSGNLAAKEQKPNLILIDGGKGQVSNVFEELKNLGMNIPIIGLAKEFEEIHFPNKRIPIILEERSEALKILQNIRDEAHRFAINFHRQRRTKNMIKSSLEGIQGLGKKRIEQLLAHFDNIITIKNASINELCKVPGINRKIAEKIYEFYKNETFLE
ncbi:MAG: excinuclease ABC subunit UvrC [Candidatus Heimdallarchaeota archaeon]|nr:excinuclease ABC subunit UvrC [Candidatus Heimdallarchaeota archaeon]